MFTHLHCHFTSSYSDSILGLEEGLYYLKEIGLEAAAITDHGVLDLCYPFYWKCLQTGLHPVLGCEVYFVEDARRSIEKEDSYRNHLILLAKNNAGFINLVRLNNASWLENNFSETRGLVDWKLLKRFHEGLIALSACFWGSLPQKYITEGPLAAERELKRYREIFGKDFYPELGRHGIPDEEKANRGLIELSRKFGLRPVVTNDCHYRQEKDWKFQDIYIKTRFGRPSDFELDARNYCLKSEAEMRELGFPSEYYDTADEIARSCKVRLEEIEPDLSPGPLREEDEAVFAGRPEKIDACRALRDVTGVWKENTGQLPKIPAGLPLAAARKEVPGLERWLGVRPRIKEAVVKLAGLPRRTGPDFDTLIDIPLSRLREFIPLKVSRGEIMAQYPLEVLRKLKVPLLPLPAWEKKFPRLYRRTRREKILARARRLMSEGDYTPAADLLKEIIRSGGGDFPEAHYSLGECFFFRRRYREAIEEYRRFAELNLSSARPPRLLMRIGWSWNWLEEPERARKAFREALEARADYPPAYYGLGVVDYRAGRKAPARAALIKYLQLEGDGGRARKARALLKRL